jgi:hypothetical protein
MVTHLPPKGRGKEKHIKELSKKAKKAALIKKQGSVWEHVCTHKNEGYEAGLKNLPFESSLIHNKGNRIVQVRTAPKYLTKLAEFQYCDEGLPVLSREIETNDLRAGNHRKIKAVDKWCEYWQPLYKEKKVTLFFITLTRLNYARISIGVMRKILRMNFERNGIKLLDYLWILEISEGLHAHYHLVIAVERVTFKKIPEFLKLEKYWGQRTEIDFVKKNVRYYLSKYFSKSAWRIDQGMRAYGKMRKPIRK